MSQPNNEVQPVVAARWLVGQLDDPSVAIVDCRFQLADPDWGRRQYLSSHLPGAYFLDLNNDLSSPLQHHGGRHPLPDLDILAGKLATMGIVLGETLVVAYDDARFAFAARLWWLLRFSGHDRVVLLDGGWPAWQAAGYPVTSEIPTPQPGNFLPRPRWEWIVGIDDIKVDRELPSVVLIDSRDGDRYRGEREPIDPIAGHIPEAVNSPWQQVTDRNGYLRPISEQQQLWENYQQAEEIIVYCGSGVTACVNFLSLEITGHRNVKLYPGGWSDWCSYSI